MAPEDSRAPFQRIPWAAALLARPNTIVRVPGSRKPKADTEDSLFAEVFKTPRTVRSCICVYTKPSTSDEKIKEVALLVTIGNGLNGHPAIMHGGIVAALLDEVMGVLQSVNMERDHLTAVGRGLAEGELPPEGAGTFTAQLNVRYLKPVATPGSLKIVAWSVKKEGRKEWIHAEVRQYVETGEDDYGESVVCASAEALFIDRKTETKL